MKESEKVTERKLNKHVEALGGWSIKLLPSVTGLPDRLVLLPGGVVLFVELKSEGKKATSIQEVVQSRIKKLGFKVYTVDTWEKVKNIKELWNS